MKKIFVIYLVLIVSLLAHECKDETTYGLMECKKTEIEKYTKKMSNYFTKAIQRQDDKKLILMMKKSQKQWLAYKKAECKAVYQMWIHGTIQGLFISQCTIDMTKQRTYEIWERYLTYMDNSIPILPEPK